MAARSRQRSRRNWPRGLSEVRPGYFAWEPPADVRWLVENLPPSGWITIGRVSLEEAIAQVTEAFLHCFGKLQERRLIHTIQQAPDTLSAWIVQYEAALAGRGIAQETIKTASRRLKLVGQALGHLQVQAVTTRHVSGYLAGLADTPRTRQAVRSLLLDLFREALSAGWCKDNPVEPTRAPRVATQRGRLSLEAFKAIHASAGMGDASN